MFVELTFGNVLVNVSKVIAFNTLIMDDDDAACGAPTHKGTLLNPY